MIIYYNFSLPIIYHTRQHSVRANVAAWHGEWRPLNSTTDPPPGEENTANMHEQPNLLRGYFFMLCLSLQFGLQPLFTQTCIEKGSHKPTLVLLCEVLKCIFAITLLYVDGGASGKEAMRRWSYKDALQCAGIPAAVYAFQNICIQMAYQNMDPILFNLLNQTKIVFTAIMVYVLMGKKQTFGQCRHS